MILIAMLMACAEPPPPAEPVVKSKPPIAALNPGPRDPSLAKVNPLENATFHDRYRKLVAMQTVAKQAIVDGSVRQHSNIGRTLSTQGDRYAKPNEIEILNEVRAHGKALMEAAPADQARAVGQLQADCGTCHTRLGASVSAEALGAPPLEFTPDLPRPKHVWAEMWLWIGLTQPSDEAWARGAAGWPGDVGAEPISGDDRIAAWAQVISSCASCHGAEERRGWGVR